MHHAFWVKSKLTYSQTYCMCPQPAVESLVPDVCSGVQVHVPLLSLYPSCTRPAPLIHLFPLVPVSSRILLHAASFFLLGPIYKV